MKISDGELRRIRLGPSEDDDDEGLFLLRVFFTAADPEAVIARAREVLGCVLERVDSWPPDEEWPKILPSWFVERFAPELTPPAPAPIFDPAARAAAWLQMWQSATPVEETAPDKTDEAEEADEGPGSLSDWLFHFDPSEEEGGGDRSWWWWDAGIDALGTGWIDVATPRLPFGTEALYRLIEASGGANPGY
ncbi:hypothetical protein [Actinoallomurus rhizosphaericola]|uniref:hypothetical protein n=1 Tax=Actinoallomurus rhizosphaericola TaxID=2952536 RepID=UPI0020924358|nr:hypothetical protein [Actinoallomurus rhizosphaericola]MCO5998791.1 hypothetical protein [Actinoallomurus rhizosphaericola]